MKSSCKAAVMWLCAAEEQKKKSDENSRQELESSVKECQDFVTELMERSEAWPFQRPVSRREVCYVS